MVPGGAYFPEVKKDTHEVDEPLSGKLKRYVSIDYGLDMLSLHWICVDIFNNAQVYREFDASDMTVSQAAEVINRIGSDEYIDSYLAPPDLWNRRQETGKSVADIFAENGIILTKTSNDLFNGCMAMKEWLRVPEDGHRPALTFLKGTAPNLIRCLQKIQKDKNKPKIYAKQPHDLTHDVDSLRCFCIWWVRAPLPDRAKDDRPKWREDLIEDYKHASREVKELMVRELGEPRL